MSVSGSRGAMGETRAKRKIREAVEAKGYTVDEIEWEPVGGMIEMSGREGGWSVFAVEGEHALGFSWQDVVEFIRDYWEPLSADPGPDVAAVSHAPCKPEEDSGSGGGSR